MGSFLKDESMVSLNVQPISRGTRCTRFARAPLRIEYRRWLVTVGIFRQSKNYRRSRRCPLHDIMYSIVYEPFLLLFGYQHVKLTRHLLRKRIARPESADISKG